MAARIQQTPAANCIELYNILTSKKISVEIHIYSKGGHGFDSGIERVTASPLGETAL